MESLRPKKDVVQRGGAQPQAAKITFSRISAVTPRVILGEASLSLYGVHRGGWGIASFWVSLVSPGEKPRSKPNPVQMVTQSPIVRHLRVDTIVIGILLLASAIFTTWPIWQDIGTLALKDEELSYVLLAPIAIAWIALVRRDRLSQYQLKRRWIGAVLVGAGYLGWIWGDHIDRISLWYLGAVLIVAGSVLSTIGTDVIKYFAPAVFAFFFLVPAPSMVRQSVSLPMQTIAVHATQSVCQVLGMDVQLQGSVLEFNGVQVGVVEACNGLRMIFTLAVVCYTFAFISPIRNGARLAILCSIPVVAIVFNVIRLVATVAVFGNASQATAQKFHDAAGWLMLVAAFGFLVMSLRVLRWAGISIDLEKGDSAKREHNGAEVPRGGLGEPALSLGSVR
jgi:exosortase